MIGYFITGTDTNVGKTFVTCSLARLAVSRGHKVFAFKPIESGCVGGPDGSYVGADQELLAAAAGDWQRGPLRGLYRFSLPAAPLVAAQAASTAVDLELVVRTCRDGAVSSDASLLLVEGAGGWRVPITHDDDMSSLARALAYSVVIVARAGLGTINHTLLTVEAVLRDGLTIAAVVISQRPEDDPVATHSNRHEILRRWPGSVVVLGGDPAPLTPLVPPSRST